MERKSRKRKIQAFPTYEKNIECIWGFLKCAIEEIQKKNNSDLSFEELYSNAYTMVFQRHGEKLYTGLKELINNHLIKVRNDLIASLDNNDKNFFKTLNQAWNDHQTTMIMIRDILMYLDRVYVKQNDVPNVYNLGLVAFNDHVIQYDFIKERLKETLLDLIERERNGEIIDRISIKNATHILMILGNNSRFVYEEIFERPYINRSIEFYLIKGKEIILSNSLSFYLEHVEACIHEETERVKHYLDKSTESLIVKVIENELIKKYLNKISQLDNSHAFNNLLLLNKSTEDLTRLYNLFSRISDGLITISQCVNAFLIKESKVNVSVNAIDYIQNLLNLQDRLEDVLINSFNNNELFKNLFKTHLENVLNLNAKSPEYLAMFIDKNLKGVKGLSEKEIELILDKTLRLLKLLQEKDVFERYYKNFLAKRLLLNKSFSDDIERNMVPKLKKICDAQFIFRVESMFKDITISETVKGLFKEYCANKCANLYGVDLSVRVLTTSYWHKSNEPPIVCNIPTASLAAFNAFKTFYMDNHRGRHLTLLPQLGTADIIAVFFSDSCEEKQGTLPRKYILQVSTYQMCILMLFNHRDRLTYEELKLETGIPEKDLIKALRTLAIGKSSQRILMKTPKTNDIESTNIFYINNSFESKICKVKIHPIKESIKVDSDIDRKIIKNNLDEDRKYQIDAAIIGIMKVKKKMHHNSLVTEIAELLPSRFLPSSLAIKQRIEKLIEMEYLSRTTEDKRVYSYIL